MKTPTLDDKEPNIPTESDDEDNDDIEDEEEVDRTSSKKKFKAILDDGDEYDTDAAEEDEEEDDSDSDKDPEDEMGDTDSVSDEGRVNLNGAMNFAFNANASEDDENEDDEDDETYLQKFEENLKTNIISDFHPEMINHNNEEVELLTRVVRDKNGTIIDPLHKSVPFITRYEKARVIGERAKQIDAGAPIFVDVEPDMIDGYLIALKEFHEKKIPFILKRPISGNYVEYWKLSDLEIV